MKNLQSGLKQIEIAQEWNAQQLRQLSQGLPSNAKMGLWVVKRGNTKRTRLLQYDGEAATSPLKRL